MELPLDHVLQPREIPAFVKGIVDRTQKEDDSVRLQGFNAVTAVPLLHNATAATIAFENIGFSVKVKDASRKTLVDKVIIEPISGVIRPGQLVAVMGPSGCGKSTLLDIIAGKKTSPYSGSVYLNGRLIDKLYDLVTAYVPQASVIPEQWTVEEAVTFSFMLRRPLPKNLKENNIAPIIRMYLQSLGLDGDVAHTRIGGPTVRGISGGQRRRLTLARGLATGAHALFCDEPTSGLSSYDAQNVIQRLKMTSIR
jgi:ABC-type multidrug transport system ATPase subunit